MKHSPTQDLIAIGGEDGIVRLYDVIDTIDDNCLQYNKSFERQDSRILSICWHPRGKVSFYYTYNGYINCNPSRYVHLVSIQSEFGTQKLEE